MEAKLQRWVQRRGWDRAVGAYHDHWRDQLRPAHDRVLDSAALVSGERVLDVACGTGLVTLPAAARVGPTGSVLATDLSPKMTADTAARACAAGLDNVDTLVAGAESIIAPDDSFDVALCSLGLMYVPEPHTAMREVRRLLRSGGRTVIAVWGRRTSCGWADLFPIVDARVDSDVCPLFFGLGAPGGAAALLDRSGFLDVDDERISVTLDYPDADSALAAAFLGGPVALAYARFDDDTKASAHAEYLASIARHRVGDGYRIPGEFVIASGRRP